MSKRAVVFGFALAIVVGALAWLARPHSFPSDRTPEGAYMRIAKSVTDDHPEQVFPYLETDAEWASFTIGDMRAKAAARIRASYPEPERSKLLAEHADEANAKDGPAVFAIFARKKGWIARLRRDLSGVAGVEVAGDRASVVTARGTRYPFRKRDNGIWGLTLFTADLMAESERATRDLSVVSAAADDYDRARANR